MKGVWPASRLDRGVEFLPSDTELQRLENENKGLTRPELSVMLAYAKLDLDSEINGSDLPDDPTFASVIFRNPTAAQLASLLAIAVPVNFVPGALPTIGNLLDFRQGNFGVRDTTGLDFNVSYRQPMGFGALSAGVAGNYIFTFKTQLSPTAPVSNQLDLGVPRMTLRGTLGAASTAGYGREDFSALGKIVRALAGLD